MFLEIARFPTELMWSSEGAVVNIKITGIVVSKMTFNLNHCLINIIHLSRLSATLDSSAEFELLIFHKDLS
jgi:hypothetical protein